MNVAAIEKVALERMERFPNQEWFYEPGINADTCSPNERQEIEEYFRSKGHTVLREKRLKSGQRLRGLWISRKKG